MGSISAPGTFTAEENLCTNCHFDEQLCLFLIIQLYCPRTKEFIISDVTMTEFHLSSRPDVATTPSGLFVRTP